MIEVLIRDQVRPGPDTLVFSWGINGAEVATGLDPARSIALRNVPTHGT